MYFGSRKFLSRVPWAVMTDVPPEADALEQHQEVVPEDEVESVSHDPEAPEADALEQAQVVPVDDDEMRG